MKLKIFISLFLAVTFILKANAVEVVICYRPTSIDVHWAVINLPFECEVYNDLPDFIIHWWDIGKVVTGDDSKFSIIDAKFDSSRVNLLTISSQRGVQNIIDRIFDEKVDLNFARGDANNLFEKVTSTDLKSDMNTIINKLDHLISSSTDLLAITFDMVDSANNNNPVDTVKANSELDDIDTYTDDIQDILDSVVFVSGFAAIEELVGGLSKVSELKLSDSTRLLLGIEDGVSKAGPFIIEHQLNNPNDNELVKIYPNPIKSAGFLFISTEITDVTISIYDISGKLILTFEKTESNELKIDIRSLNPGLYLCEVASENKRIQVDKIVILN
ncbi:MAG: T9SS type A sorting domain-containing protein [Bacteroidetes bacterium]|nr:T9SS type A sorting domain-containing protein [Bacteroidota bacterium]